VGYIRTIIHITRVLEVEEREQRIAKNFSKLAMILMHILKSSAILRKKSIKIIYTGLVLLNLWLRKISIK
jgi:hypothetical protein